jgi:hypothetical protein
MAKAEPITPERILKELETATLLSQVTIPLISGNDRFREMLEDDVFAREAQRIIEEKISKIEEGDIMYAKGSGSEISQVKTVALSNWKKVLECVNSFLPSKDTRNCYGR